MLPLTAQAAAHCRAPETSAGVLVAAATTVLVASAAVLLLENLAGIANERSGRGTLSFLIRKTGVDRNSKFDLICYFFLPLKTHKTLKTHSKHGGRGEEEET